MNLTKNESANFSAIKTSLVQPTSTLETSTKVGMAIGYSIIFTSGLIGNILIIYIVMRKPYMKSTINFLIANMAAADLIMILFAMPYSVFYLYYASMWIGGTLGQVTCKIVHFSIGLSIAASISTLIVISLDRFFAIVYPFRRSSVIKKIPITISIIWVTSAILLSPYFYIFGVQQHSGVYHCLVSIGNNSLQSLGVYHMITFGALYVIPLTLIGAFYFAVCRKLWLRKIPGNPSAINLETANRLKKRTIKMLIIIVIVFGLCWLPAHVMHMFVFFNHEVYKTFPQYAILLAFFVSHANSAVNPFLYIRLNKNFMHAFTDVVIKLRKWRKASARRRRKSITTTSMTNLSVIASESQMISLRSSPIRRKGRYEFNNEVSSVVINQKRQVSLASTKCIV